MSENEKARALHDEALRVRLEPIGAEWVRTGFYRIGTRVYDFTAIDPNKIAVALSRGLCPYAEPTP